MEPITITLACAAAFIWGQVAYMVWTHDIAPSIPLWKYRFWTKVLPEEKRKTYAMDVFRREMALFGFPMDDLTDEEIEEGTRRLGEAAREAALTADEAADAMRILGWR